VNVVAVTALTLWLAAMSACDLRTRQVPNWLTLPPLLGILGWQLAHGCWLALLPLPVFFSLWHVQVLGGADAKVLMSLFGLWPTLEFASFFCLGYVLVTLPLLAWRRWRNGNTLLSDRRPAVPTYATVTLAYMAIHMIREKG
jgi:Flp pilus assembly protein protease CpaA